MLSSCVTTLEITEVALITEVFKAGEGVIVLPSAPERTSVDVLVIGALVMLVVNTCFSVMNLVV